MKTIKFMISTLMMGLSVLFLLQNQIIPIILQISISLLILLIGVAIYQRKILSRIFTLVMFIFIISSIFVQTQIRQFISPTQVETQNFSVYISKESDIQAMSEVKDLELIYPLQVQNTFLNNLSLEWKDLGLNYSMVQSSTEAIQSFLKDSSTLVLLDNAYLDPLDPTVIDFISKTHVIGNYQKEIIKQALRKPKEITEIPFVVYISGIDTDGPIDTIARSDVNIIVIVNPLTQMIDMTSIARDSYLPIACQDNHLDKLTHTGFYGINCSIDTLQENFDVDINYYVKLNFTSFLDIVNLFDTIHVHSDFSFSSGGYSFEKGDNVLSSEAALAFARTRKVFKLGDFQRGLNQQEVMKGLFAEILKVKDVNKLLKISKAITKSVTTNLSSDELEKLIQFQLFNQIDWQINTSMIEGTRGSAPSYAFGGEYHNMVFLNEESITSFKQKYNDIINLR